jgi:hypothetical protein
MMREVHCSTKDVVKVLPFGLVDGLTGMLILFR